MHEEPRTSSRKTGIQVLHPPARAASWQGRAYPRTPTPLAPHPRAPRACGRVTQATGGRRRRGRASRGGGRRARAGPTCRAAPWEAGCTCAPHTPAHSAPTQGAGPGPVMWRRRGGTRPEGGDATGQRPRARACAGDGGGRGLTWTWWGGWRWRTRPGGARGRPGRRRGRAARASRRAAAGSGPRRG